METPNRVDGSVSSVLSEAKANMCLEGVIMRTIELCLVLLLAIVSTACEKGLAPGTGPTPVPSTNMTWRFEKTCNDGYTTSLKLYDRDSGAVWPSNTRSWTFKSGESITETISCSSGNKICFGAANNADDSLGYWGIGIGHFLGCTDCCRSCGTSSDVINTLKCGR